MGKSVSGKKIDRESMRDRQRKNVHVCVWERERETERIYFSYLQLPILKSGETFFIVFQHI